MKGTEGAKPTVPAAPVSKDDRTITAPKALRDQLEKTTGELKEIRSAKESLEAKIAKFESQGKDTTALTERLTAIEKERDEALSQVRALKQEASPEFKDKWDKPFNQAADYAKGLIEQLQVGEWVQNEETGTREWKAARAATWEDFIGLYNMPAAKAAQGARAMFGEDASLVIGQLNDLHLKDFQRGKALEEEKARWKETETKEQSESARRKESWSAATSKAELTFKEKYPDRYSEDPEDKEGNELLKEGQRMLEYQPKTFDQAVANYVRIRLNAAAAPRAFHRAALLKERVAELEAEVKELRESGPGKTVRSTGGSGAPEKDWRDELREIKG